MNLVRVEIDLFEKCVEGYFDWRDLDDHPSFVALLLNRMNVTVKVQAARIAPRELVGVVLGAVGGDRRNQSAHFDPPARIAGVNHQEGERE